MRFSEIYVSAVSEKDGYCGIFDDSDPDQFAAAKATADRIFWSVYGVEDAEEALSVCIGDFKSRKFAEEMADALRAGTPDWTPASKWRIKQ